MAFKLTSAAFTPGASIPLKYTCDGNDVSPALQWTEPPPGTRSFALLVDDPDGGDWVHWLIYNLPADARALPEAVSPDTTRPDGSRQGKNSWNRIGYGGPCPPRGTHRYYFRLYALDTVLNVPAGATKSQVFQALQGHIQGQAELMGTYTRK